jgi:prepilin peptidase CpaA
MSGPIYAGLMATAVASCIWDVRTHRIPNALTIGSAALGCAVYGVESGWRGAGFSAAGWGTGLLLFLPWFLAGGMGGGDVKLLAAFGAWLGPSQTLRACLFAMIAGGVCALVIVIRQRRLRPALEATLMLAMHPGMVAGAPVEGQTAGKHGGIAYAIPVALGVGMALWLG